jgi:transposase
VEAVLAGCFLDQLPERLIGDKAYDSDALDQTLAEQYGVAIISPNRRNRKQKTQDGRQLRRYRRRWKVERLFAWMHNFRRLVTR